MAAIDAKLFKKYDIRGRALGENPPLTPDVARRIGHAFGTWLREHSTANEVVVGRDNRHSSPALAEAAIEGIRASGCNVVDIGLVMTPLVYWWAVQRGNAGGLMVTGSHLAPDQNGFKLSVGPRNLFGDDLQALRGLIESGALAQGRGAVEQIDEPFTPYMAQIVPSLPMARALRIVVDPGNGTAGLFAPRLFEAWSHHVTCIFCEPDGDYPNHQPDPQVPANMVALRNAVREHNADLGIAFDGDADRMGAVDETGRVITADRLLALLARDMLSRHPGASVVADVLCSQVLFDEVAAANGVPIMWASGHSLVKSKMAEVGALLGGEMSGHIFLGEDYYGFDDACLAAGRLLQIVASTSMTLSQIDATLPTLFSTPEYRPHCPDEAKAKVIEGVAAALAGEGEVVSVDGVRIRFERGWGLLRASNTEPVLSLRFEGETEADAWRYRDLFAAALRQFPEVEPLPDHDPGR
ncbi:MAG: phosphomannomutase/phosphoglucomutase [Chloroflexota bacterium]|nr:MAG: phosphomannomutase [Chloroflexota bacterium]